MSQEVEENLTLFFRRFLNTSEEMDAHLGFNCWGICLWNVIRWY
jgi:hypothetical protein